MAEAKTKPTKASVAAYIAAIPDETRRKDCKTLVRMMKKVTGKPAKMWGPSIVGFGKYHYVYDSGHEGDTCLAAFSSRKPDLNVYLFPVFPHKEALLKKLGKHRTGKGCLYIRNLAQVDLGVLEQLVVRSMEEAKRRYPGK